MDKSVVLAVKPAGVLSTDEPGGMPELLFPQCGRVRTVHRLDRAVSGLMVFARTANCAGELSRQVRESEFKKRYLAVIHGCPPEESGSLRDLLARDRARRMTFVASAPGKDAHEAILNYRLLAAREGLSLVRVELLTGRTHQIRVQFASRGLPIAGDRKYGLPEDTCGIALWSEYISFIHPFTHERAEFTAPPPETEPWSFFQEDMTAWTR